MRTASAAASAHNTARPSEPAQVAFPTFAPSRAELQANAGAVARVVFGWCTFASLPVLVALCWPPPTGWPPPAERHLAGPPALVYLIACWAVAGLAAVIARVLVEHGAVTSLRPSRHLSYAAAAFGVAMLAPMTLTCLVDAPAWAPGPWVSLVDDRLLSTWVVVGTALTALSHLIFATLIAVRAWRVVKHDVHKPHYGVIIAASAAGALIDCGAYGVFGLLPVLYVAVVAAVLCRIARALEPRLLKA